MALTNLYEAIEWQKKGKKQPRPLWLDSTNDYSFGGHGTGYHRTIKTELTQEQTEKLIALLEGIESGQIKEQPDG